MDDSKSLRRMKNSSKKEYTFNSTYIEFQEIQSNLQWQISGGLEKGVEEDMDTKSLKETFENDENVCYIDRGGYTGIYT